MRSENSSRCNLFINLSCVLGTQKKCLVNGLILTPTKVLNWLIRIKVQFYTQKRLSGPMYPTCVNDFH